MKNKIFVIFGFVVVLVMAVCAFGQNTSGDPNSGKTTAKSSPALESLIRTAQPSQRTFTLQVKWLGAVESKALINLTALVDGRVEAVVAQDQHHVNKGQLVVQLGGPQIDNARARLDAEVETLNKQVQIARESLVRVKDSLKNHLATKDQEAVMLESKIKLEARLSEVRLNLDILNSQSHISSPMDGIFTNRRVNPGQDVTAGQVLGDIIDTGQLRVIASLVLPRALDLKDRQALVRVGENQILKGIVKQVLPMTTSAGATTVWIESPQINANLHPGQTVSGVIVAKPRSNILAVPESAVVYDDEDHPFLFIFEKGNYVKIGIQTGMEQDGWVEILSGLKGKQPVVVRGAYELFYKTFSEQFKVQD